MDDILVAIQYSRQVVDSPESCKAECDDMRNVVTPLMTGPLDKCQGSKLNGTAFENMENVTNNARGPRCFNLGSSVQVQKGGRQGPVANMRANVRDPVPLNLKTRLNKVCF